MRAADQPIQREDLHPAVVLAGYRRRRHRAQLRQVDVAVTLLASDDDVCASRDVVTSGREARRRGRRS